MNMISKVCAKSLAFNSLMIIAAASDSDSITDSDERVRVKLTDIQRLQRKVSKLTKIVEEHHIHENYEEHEEHEVHEQNGLEQAQSPEPQPGYPEELAEAQEFDGVEDELSSPNGYPEGEEQEEEREESEPDFMAEVEEKHVHFSSPPEETTPPPVTPPSPRKENLPAEAVEQQRLKTEWERKVQASANKINVSRIPLHTRVIPPSPTKTPKKEVDKTPGEVISYTNAK